jgi:hypothetical protein
MSLSWCSKVATPGNTICDDDNASLHQFIYLHVVDMIRQPLTLAPEQGAGLGVVWEAELR